MTKIVMLAICLQLALNIKAQENENIYADGHIKCQYALIDGQLHGKYISWYSNGVKKSEGKFYQNNRIGLWTLWDSIGNVRVKRIYKNNFVYKRILPTIPKDKSIKLLNYYPPLPIRNEGSYFDYFALKEKNVVYCERYLSIILPEKNPILFASDDILMLLLNNRDSADFHTYKIFESYKEKKFEVNSLKNIKLIAFKTTKEYVYDLERQLMESRIIFISPVLLDTITNEIYDDNWFYFNNLVPHLAKIKIESKNKKIDIQNVSDLFFWQQFSDITMYNLFSIYGEKFEDIETSVFTKKDIISELLAKSEEYQIKEIETEHDLLIKFTKIHKRLKID